MGGRIGVESQPGVGSTFWFTAELDPVPDGVVVADLCYDLQGLRALIVDDNATNRAILTAQLNAQGVACDTAASGQHGLDLLRAAARDARPYDLAILDMLMPEMDGLQLAEQVRREAAIAATPLVLLTSLGRIDREQIAAVGFSAALSKPTRQSQLFAALARAVGRGLAAPAPAAAPLTADELPAPPIGNALVLVVEDSAINQKVALGILKKLGYRADAVGNGREALEALGRIPYAAVLMDCQMPEMDGFEASIEIRRRERGVRHTPVIAMTANAMKGDRERCLAAGMDDYLSKPVRTDDVAAVLDRWVPRPQAAAPDLAAPAEPTVPPIDLAAVSALAGGDAVLLAELVAMFSAETPARLAAIGAAVEQYRPAELRRVAHLLRGEANALHATAMADLCEQLETLGREGSVDGAPALLTRLEAAFARTRHALEQETLRTAGVSTA